jgi:hypothetical protein
VHALRIGSIGGGGYFETSAFEGLANEVAHERLIFNYDDVS